MNAASKCATEEEPSPASPPSTAGSFDVRKARSSHHWPQRQAANRLCSTAFLGQLQQAAAMCIGRAVP